MSQRSEELVEARLRTASSLNINVTGSVGSGPTSLAAFDDALAGAGVSNFNLIRLSSVIPPRSVVRPRPREESGIIDLRDGSMAEFPGGPVDMPSPEHLDWWGNRLYAVWAFQSAELLGQEAWAGVSWVQDPSDGRGVFVEHEGSSEAQVRAELEASLTSISTTRGLDRFEFKSVVVGTTCEVEPVAALVIAPFMTSGW